VCVSPLKSEKSSYQGYQGLPFVLPFEERFSYFPYFNDTEGTNVTAKAKAKGNYFNSFKSDKISFQKYDSHLRNVFLIFLIFLILMTQKVQR
jgi:hypothetical protein